MQLSTV